VIAPPPNVQVWLACRLTDIRKGFDGLASLAQNHLGKDPFSGQLFVFRGVSVRSAPPCSSPLGDRQ